MLRRETLAATGVGVGVGEGVGVGSGIGSSEGISEVWMRKTWLLLVRKARPFAPQRIKLVAVPTTLDIPGVVGTATSLKTWLLLVRKARPFAPQRIKLVAVPTTPGMSSVPAG